MPSLSTPDEPAASNPVPRGRRLGRRRVLAICAAGALVAVALLAAWLKIRQLEVGSYRIGAADLWMGEVESDAAASSTALAVPMPTPQTLRPGVYRWRGGRPGELSSTALFSVAPGDHTRLSLEASDSAQLPAIDVHGQYAWMPLERGHDLVTVDDAGVVSRVRSANGEQIWTFVAAEHHDELTRDAPGFRWPDATRWPWRDPRPKPWMIGASVDLTDDGVPDVLLAGHQQAWLLALDGATGDRLWLAARGADVVSSDPMPNWRAPSFRSAIVDEPRPVPDADGDGCPDIAILWAQCPYDGRSGKLRSDPERTLEVVSGATGRKLWQTSLPGDWFQVATEPIPMDFRWRMESPLTSSSGGSSSHWYNRFVRGRPSWSDRSQCHYVPGLVGVVPATDREGGEPVLAVQCGETLAAFGTSGGELRTADRLGARPGQRLRLANLAGDASPEVIVLSSDHRAQGTETSRLSVWSWGERRELWRRDLDVAPPWTMMERESRPAWPLIEDLDGDGPAELIAPTTCPDVLGPEAPWGELSLFNGATGKPLWTRRLFTADQQLDFFELGPDINSDGWREVYVAVLWGGKAEVYVDCLSGRDGGTLWRRSRTLDSHWPISPQHHLGPLSWSSPGADGWARLIVPVSWRGFEKPVCFLFSAGTGELTHVARDVAAVRSIDVNGDSHEDLVAESPKGQTGHRLSSLRGDVLDHFRWIEQPKSSGGGDWNVAADFDDDGTDDLVRVDRGGILRAASSARGVILWERRYPELENPNQVYVVRAADVDDPNELDLDRDGTPDLLLGYNSSLGRDGYSPVHLYSGRTGRRVWTAGFRVEGATNQPLIAIADLDGDDSRDVLVLGEFSRGAGSIGGGPWTGTASLVALSGVDGKVRWRREIGLNTNPWNMSWSSRLQHRHWWTSAVTDVDGDGRDDVLLHLPSASGTQQEWRTYNGAGEILWRANSPGGGDPDNFPIAMTTDLDGDGRKEVIGVHRHPAGGPTSGWRVQVLEGDNGHQKWDGVWPKVPGDTFHGDPWALLLRRRDAQPWIGLSGADSVAAFTVFDQAGKTVQITDPTLLRPGVRRESAWFWACDVDRDGADELIGASEKRLFALRPAANPETLWERAWDEDRQGIRSVLDVWPARENSPALVFVYEPAEASVRAYDAANGKLIAYCPVSAGVEWMASPLTLLPDRRRPELPPRLLIRGPITLCRQFVWADPRGAVVPLPRVSPVVEPGRDPRMARRLPWNLNDSTPSRTRLRWRYSAWSGYLGLALLVGPGLVLQRLVTKRRFSLRFMFGMTAVVAFMFLALRMEHPGFGWMHPDYRWSDALTSLPAWLLALALGRSCWRGNWRALCAQLCLTVIVGLLLAGHMLWFDRTGSRRPVPGEYYDWDGWYWFLVAGAYGLGVLISLGVVLLALIRVCQVVSGSRRAQSPTR